MIPYLLTRNGQMILNNLGVRLTLDRYSWMAVGGPDECWLDAAGSEPGLLEFSDALRCPLEIQTEEGIPVWWGFVDGIFYRFGQLSLSITLDYLANRVSVAYTSLLPSPEQYMRPFKSAWHDHLDSQAAYGVKEYLYRMGNGVGADASALAEVLLGKKKYPVASLGLDTDPAAGAGQAVTKLVTDIDVDGARVVTKVRARGWWHTTGWRVYDQPAGLEQIDLPAGGMALLGNVGANQGLLQYFTSQSNVGSWKAEKAWIRVSKYGVPADSLYAQLVDGGGGVLGTTNNLAAGSMTPGGGWQVLTFPVPPTIQTGTGYSVRVFRTGVVDAANYYRIGVSPFLSNEGASSWNGSAWVGLVPGVNVNFKLVGSEDSALQMARMLVSSCGGQFFSGLDLPASSGVSALLWREGLRSAREELEELMLTGTGDGRRYLASVDPARRATIDPEPAAGSADWGIAADGTIVDNQGAKIAQGVCPVGVWVKAVDLPPVVVSGQQMADPARVMVERAEWSAVSGRVRLVPR